MKHTPAPWRVQPSTRTDQHIIAGKRWIATVSNHDFHPTEEENERTKANAHLIAAAPDMAEALHHALRLMLTGHQLAQTDSDAAWMFIHKAEDACRRAIARAEGKA